MLEFKVGESLGGGEMGVNERERNSKKSYMHMFKRSINRFYFGVWDLSEVKCDPLIL